MLRLNVSSRSSSHCRLTGSAIRPLPSVCSRAAWQPCHSRGGQRWLPKYCSGRPQSRHRTSPMGDCEGGLIVSFLPKSGDEIEHTRSAVLEAAGRTQPRWDDTWPPYVRAYAPDPAAHPSLLAGAGPSFPSWLA